MSPLRTAVVGALLAGLAASSLGQESAPPAPPQPAATPPASPAPPAAQRPVADDDEFVPTEELSADEQVTFPVDI